MLALREWAKRHSLSVFTSRLLRLVASPQKPKFIGAIPLFLATPETLEVLRQWAASDSGVNLMLRFGEALRDDPIDFDPIAPDRPLDRQFPGFLKTDFLGISLSVRQPSNRPTQEQLAIRQFQTWLLLRALDFERQNIPFEKRILTIATDLRIALDDNTFGDLRLDPILRLAKKSDSRATFEENLRYTLGREKLTPEDKFDQLAPSGVWWKNFLSALNRLLDPDERGLAVPAIRVPGQVDIPHQTEEFQDGVPPAVFPDPDDAGVCEIELHSPRLDSARHENADDWDDEGEHILRIALEPADRATPLHAIYKGTGLVLKTQEGLNFLPFSYEHLRQDERSLLFGVLEKNLVTPFHEHSLLAAITWLAILTKRSMDTVTAIQLVTNSTAMGSALDWRVDLQSGVVLRPTPRRSSGWSPQADAEDWIQPLRETWTFHLSPQLLAPLLEALALNPEARQLGDLWRGQLPLSTAFNNLCKSTEGLARVRSGMISTIGELQTFESTGDATLARMMHGPPRSGLPGSAAYPSATWINVEQEMRALSRQNVVAAADGSGSPDDNALGSRLNPLDDRLAAEFSHALGLVNAPALDFKGRIDQHNLLVGYITASGLAASGVRPVRSPFEAVGDFNFEAGLHFVEDKVQYSKGDGPTGRILPMAKIVGTLFKDIYLPHRQKLMACGAWVSEPIRATASDSNRDPLPFLFFIDPQTLQPVEVSEQSLSALGLFRWKLPWNLFRHRMATRLRQARLDSELIDAQLGHAELGATTFGDHSMRCFSQDLPVWREKLEEILAPLHIGVPVWDIDSTATLASELVAAMQSKGCTLMNGSPMVFGREARRQQRIKNHQLVKQQAILEIEDFLGGRSPEQLTTSEWERLGDSMLFTSNNTARTSATLRYETFERYLTSQWREKGVRPQLRYWYTRPAPPRPAFSVESLHAGSVLKSIDLAFGTALADLVPTRCSLQDCAAAAAMDLALSSGVSDPEVLLALLERKKNTFALTLLRGQAYLEYSDIAAVEEQKGLQRYLVASRSVAFLSNALAHTNSMRQPKSVSKWARPVAFAAGLPPDTTTYPELLERIARVVGGYNSIHLPGILAGALAGRVKTYALDRSSWLRALKDQAFTPPAIMEKDSFTRRDQVQGGDEIDPSDREGSDPIVETAEGGTDTSAAGFQPTASGSDPSLDFDISYPLKVRPRQSAPALALGKNAQLAAPTMTRTKPGRTPEQNSASVVPIESAVKQLGRILKDFAGPSGKPGERKNTDNQTRRDTRARVRALLERPPPGTSSAVVMFVAWALHLLDRPYRSALLNASTVRTYVSTLASGFEAFGEDGDIADFDEDELTDFYLRICELNIVTAHDGDESDQAPPTTDSDAPDQASKAPPEKKKSQSAPTVSVPVGALSKQAYVLARLQDFHRYASKQFGLAEADWSSIDPGYGGSTVSAGLVTPREYSYALELLCPDPTQGPLSRLRDAFVLP